MQNFTNEPQIRKEICEIGQRLYDKGFVAANDGNISVRLSDDVIIVTPTGISKGFMRPEWLIKMNLNGDVLDGTKKPSSEVKMHIEVYKQSKDIQSVVHAHPPVATAFAVARRPLDRPIISEAILTLGVVPVADYATPTTNEVPESIRPFIKEYNSVLLANHGLLSWGKDITQAFFRMESCEQYAKILYYLGEMGKPQEITSENVEKLVKIREVYGVSTGGTPTSKKSSGIGEVDTEELIRTITKNVIDSLK